VKVRLFAVLALAFCLTRGAVAAEGWHRPFEVLGPDQGLPNGGITCLAQDAAGFIWLGTGNGLLRYEGGHYTRWTRKDGLPSDYVDRLLPAPEGGLWVSTARGLARFQKGRIEPAQFEAQATAPTLDSMATDASGHLWAATTRGLFVQAQELLFRPHPGATLGQKPTVASGRAGTMHVGSTRGLITFQADGTSQSWSPDQGLPRVGVTLVGEDGAGRLWVCTGRELVMKEPGAAVFTDQSRLLHAPVTPYGSFFQDRDGSLWLPTREGALHLDGTRSTQLDAAAGLPMRWVRNVFRDREGGFWILGAVLARLQGNGQVSNHPLIAGPSGGIVWAMTRDARGQLLAGTDDGVARLGATGVQRIPGTEGHRVKSLTLDRTGRLWMVGTLGPTLWLAPGGTRATVAPLGELGSALNTVMTDSLGQVWIGHGSKGILRWDAARQRLVQEVGPAGVPSGNLGVFQIREDRMGRLWAASTRGLHLRERSGVWRLFTKDDGLPPFGLYGLAFLADGSAWVHFNEPQGLMRIRIEGDHLSVLDQRRAGQGLRSDLVYAVDVDPQGRTWATTDSGLDCLDTRVHVGRHEGMASEDCDLFGLLAESDRVWVGTAAGLVRYDTGDPEPPLPAPRPHILQLIQGEQRLDAPAQTFGPVDSRNANLAFRVAVPSYRHEGQLRTQVRLVGLEGAWRDLDAPLTRYQALPGGSYRFEARAAQPDGEFGPVVSLSFRVLPPWWRTWWMLALWGMAAMGLIRLIVRLRVASLARSKAELEALVAERTEELRDRNVEITDALGRVKQLSGLLPICASCKKIRDDKGYWNQLEHYISEHSEVDFSHGICPDCVGTLFPAYAARHEHESGKPSHQAEG
jgi:ligand-binding sensor domain-containing protein